MSFFVFSGSASGHSIGMRWLRANASTHCWYSCVRLANASLVSGVDAVHVAEEMDDVLRPRQQREVALNDDAIETVVYKPEQAAKQLVKGFHRSSPLMRASATRSCARRLVETTSFDRLRPERSEHPQFHNQGLCP